MSGSLPSRADLLGIVAILAPSGLISLPGYSAGMAIGAAGFWPVFIYLALAAVGTSCLLWRLQDETSCLRRPGCVWVVFVVGVMLAALGTEPWLDDDVYRYMWDGFVVASGGNPLLTLPEAAGGFPAHLLAKVSYSTIPSIYPPVAQIFFGGVWWLFAAWMPGWALVWSALAIIAGALLGALCRAHGAPRWLWPALVLNPVLVKEFVDSYHVDAFALVLVLIGLVSLSRSWSAVGQICLAGVFVGLAASVKPQALVLVPFLPGCTVKQRGAAGVVAMGMVGLSAVLYFGNAATGRFYLEMLRYFRTHWLFNPFVVDVVSLGIRGAGMAETRTSSLQAAMTWVPAVADGFFVATAILLQRHASGALLGAVVVSIWLVCQPVVNPWYCWLLWPMVAIYSGKAVERYWRLLVPVMLLPTVASLTGYPYWIELQDVFWLRIGLWVLWAGFAFTLGFRHFQTRTR